MSALSTFKPLDTLESLPRTPASNVKKLGWRGVVDTVRREGTVVVTNHGRPEMVIVPPEEYERLLKASHDIERQNRIKLAELQREYDEKLQWIDEPGVGDKLRNALRKPLKLHGNVIAGTY